MNGASWFPMMSPRLLFSITSVNTVPVQPGAALAGPASSALHATLVSPSVFAQPPTASARIPHTMRCFIGRQRGRESGVWQGTALAAPEADRARRAAVRVAGDVHVHLGGKRLAATFARDARRAIEG